jgi:hypothetical protein
MSSRGIRTSSASLGARSMAVYTVSSGVGSSRWERRRGAAQSWPRGTRGEIGVKWYPASGTDAWTGKVTKVSCPPWTECRRIGMTAMVAPHSAVALTVCPIQSILRVPDHILWVHLRLCENHVLVVELRARAPSVVCDALLRKHRVVR